MKLSLLFTWISGYVQKWFILRFRLHNVSVNHRRIGLYIGAQSSWGGTTFLPEKYVWKINKIPEFYTILARKNYHNTRIFYYICPKKITKFLDFTWFLPENSRILHKKLPEFFSEFQGARALPCPPSPTPMEYSAKLEVEMLHSASVFYVMVGFFQQERAWWLQFSVSDLAFPCRGC